MSSLNASVSMRWLRSTESRGSAMAAVAHVMNTADSSSGTKRLARILMFLSEGEVEPRTNANIPVVPKRNIRPPRLVQHGGRERQIPGEAIPQTDISRIELVLPAGVQSVGEPIGLKQWRAHDRPFRIELDLDAEDRVEAPAPRLRQI